MACVFGCGVGSQKPHHRAYGKMCEMADCDSLSPTEAQAKDVLEEALSPCTVALADTAGRQSQYDFDVVLADGSELAVEVTQASDQARIALGVALARHGTLDNPGRLAWQLDIRPGVKAQGALRAALPSLLQLEGAGQWIYGFHSCEDYPDVPEAVTLSAIGVEGWLAFVPGPSGRPIVTSVVAGEGGIKHESLVIEAAVAEARKPDNLAKLARAHQSEKHLFVWVDWFGEPLLWSTVQSQEPIGLPDLPPPLTGLWIAAGINDFAVVWRYQSDEGWAVYPHIPVHLRFGISDC